MTLSEIRWRYRVKGDRQHPFKRIVDIEILEDKQEDLEMARKRKKAKGDSPMATLPSGNYESLALYSEKPGGSMVPENIAHYYGVLNKTTHKLEPDSTGFYPLQVQSISHYANGSMPADPPAKHKAPGFVQAPEPKALEPKAAYREDGSVATAGFLPNGEWVDTTPALVLTDEQKAAKAFHDALADPSSLVKKAGPEGTSQFVVAILNAVKAYIGQ